MSAKSAPVLMPSEVSSRIGFFDRFADSRWSDAPDARQQLSPWLIAGPASLDRASSPDHPANPSGTRHTQERAGPADRGYVARPTDRPSRSKSKAKSGGEGADVADPRREKGPQCPRDPF